MDYVSDRWFGLVIAYVLPGLVAVVGFSPMSQTIQGWLKASQLVDPGVSGFLLLVTSSTGVGLVVGCIRWCTVDQLMRVLGVKRPEWDDSQLHEKLQAYDLIIQHHYRYYQFYAAVLIVLPFSYVSLRIAGTPSSLGYATDALLLFIEVTLFAGSMDTLAKYHQRALKLLGPQLSSKENVMTNGAHHEESGGKSDGKKNTVATHVPTPATAPTVTAELKPSVPLGTSKSK
jgi:hypothetical protein